jgi:hypothetical protein
LAKSIEEISQNLKSITEVNKVLIKMALEAARAYYQRALEALEEYLFETRDKRLKVEHKRAVYFSFPLGDVRVERRQYLDTKGASHYLLDELVGRVGNSPFTPELKEIAVFLSTRLPFRQSAEVLGKCLPQAALSHTTIHRLVCQMGRDQLACEEAERKRIYERGEIPESEARVIPHLMVEADGVNISLQREKNSKAEIKVGIAYEGWEAISRGRYQVCQKTSYCALESEQSFWENFSLKLAYKYNLSQIKHKVVGGDGAGWVKSGVELLEGRFQLDRFHLLRALRRALSQQTDLVYPVYRACGEGNTLLALTYLNQAKKASRGEEREKIRQLINYLQFNLTGLKDYRLDIGTAGQALRRTGAIESNVDKLVANRMKKRGMSWTMAGAKLMACLITVVHSGSLRAACYPHKLNGIAKLPLKKIRRILVKNYKDTEQKWLQSSLPALYGPHANRAWVKSLKCLSEVSLNV